MGVLLALVISAGLAWWLAAPDHALTPESAPSALPRRPPAQPAPRAPPAADPAQVQSAFVAVQDAYADGGGGALARADADCAAALKGDGRVLDYCLAFDMFAAAVAPEVAPADPDAARLAAARAALPAGADPAERVAQVRALMRQASLGTAPAPPARAQSAPPVRLAAGANRRGPASKGAEQRREDARAAVRALFARAEAAQDADAIAKLYAERTRPPEDEAPH